MKNSYFTSRNSHLTNKPEADSVLMLPPSLHQGSVLEVRIKLLKVIRKRKKSKEEFEATEAHTLTRRVLIILPQSKVLYWLSVNNYCN